MEGLEKKKKQIQYKKAFIGIDRPFSKCLEYSRGIIRSQRFHVDKLHEQRLKRTPIHHHALILSFLQIALPAKIAENRFLNLLQLQTTSRQTKIATNRKGQKQIRLLRASEK